MKKIIKTILIVVSILLLIYLLFINSIASGNIIDGFLFMMLNCIFEFGEIDSMLFVLAITCLIIGLLINTKTPEKIKKTIIENNNYKSLIIKHTILRSLGFLPFLIVLVYGCYCMVFGFSIFFSTEYGIRGFLFAILTVSIFIWPIYIVGIILIIKSSRKLKELDNNKN